MARDPLGTVTQVSARGDLVVALHGALPRGAGVGLRLVDARRERVGRVVDVIGPVAKPYAVVAPPRERTRGPLGRGPPRGGGGPNLLRLLGKELFPE